MHIDELRTKANRLPLLPGVYLMLDEAGEVIYVGKAKKLKNRVSSYFRGEHLPKVGAMVAKVNDFNVIVAESEFEALCLENSLIKRHQPHYNILLKDDKAYPYIRLDVKSRYPRFSISNNVVNDGAKYFGPYGGRVVSKNIIDTLSKALKLPTCGKKFPRGIGKERPCLNYHMGNCLGYCAGKAGEIHYNQSIRDAEMILNGKSAELRSDLEREMQTASEAMQFERAAELRDRLRSIEGLQNRQNVIGAGGADTDVVGFYRGVKFSFAVLHYHGGNLVDKDYRLIDEPVESDEEAVSALVRQYYAIRGAYPRSILMSIDTGDREDIERMLTELAGRKVNVEIPQRGERRLMTEKANLNAREECVRATTAAQKRQKTLQWLADTLGLDEAPRRIESFDISNTGNFGIVASMVVFADGKPLKRDYRKFKIKELSAQDDYGSMREVLTRRFNRYLKGDERFGQLPDLLLVDGGAVHAAVAEGVLHECGLHIPVLGMVKDDRHRTRALIRSDGSEIGITGMQSAFSLIGTIQEETHRFAIEYHKNLRSATIGSQLENINGVGETRRNQLLKHFKTIKAIKAAEYEELCAVVPKNTARAVYDYFHGGETPKGDKEAAENSEENI